MISIFKYSQFNIDLKDIEFTIVGGPKGKRVEIVAGQLGPEMCEKARRALEAAMGLSQEDVLSESKHSGVEEKMLSPIEEEQEAAPAVEKQQEKF